MTDLTSGVVQIVNATNYGDAAVVAAPIGSTTLTVDDPGDFNEEGGNLAVKGVAHEYDSVDHDTGVITLTGALTVAVEESDAVDVLTAVGLPAVEWTAEIVTPGSEVPITVTIPSGLVAYFPEGDALEGELVGIGPDPFNPGSYEVKSQPGQQPQFDGSAVWNPYVSARVPTPFSVAASGWTTVTTWAEAVVQGVKVETDGSLTVLFPGFYVADAAPSYVSNSTGSRAARFLVNGVQRGYLSIPADAVGSTEVPVGFRRPLLEGDNIVFQLSQSSGAALGLSSVNESPLSLYRTSV